MSCRLITYSALIACTLAAHSAAAAPAGSVVFSFKSNGNGGTPEAALLKSGPAYFTTTFYGGLHHCTFFGRPKQCGTVVRLLPPDTQHTGWREKPIYHFAPSPDASSPAGGITVAKGRTFYVLAAQGGATSNGALVALTPPSSGDQWKEQILYNFAGIPDGSNPRGRAEMDSAGNLYVLTALGGSKGLGTLVELSPPVSGQSAWTEKVLYNFGSSVDGQGPTSSPQSDGHGGFYVTTGGYANAGAGALVDLVPGQGGSGWTEQVLATFGGLSAPQTGGFATGGIVADTQGNLYGAAFLGGAYGNGLVYELSPPTSGAGLWTETVLYAFTASGDGANPNHAPHFDAAGNLYLTTTDDSSSMGGGTVVKLTPPGAGQSAWTETTLYHFRGKPDGSGPFGGLTVEDSGNFLVPTIGGGQFDQGAIVEITGTGFAVK